MDCRCAAAYPAKHVGGLTRHTRCFAFSKESNGHIVHKYINATHPSK